MNNPRSLRNGQRPLPNSFQPSGRGDKQYQQYCLKQQENARERQKMQKHAQMRWEMQKQAELEAELEDRREASYQLIMRCQKEHVKTNEATVKAFKLAPACIDTSIVGGPLRQAKTSVKTHPSAFNARVSFIHQKNTGRAWATFKLLGSKWFDKPDPVQSSEDSHVWGHYMHVILDEHGCLHYTRQSLPWESHVLVLLQTLEMRIRKLCKSPEQHVLYTVTAIGICANIWGAHVYGIVLFAERDGAVYLYYNVLVELIYDSLVRMGVREGDKKLFEDVCGIFL